ncbi:DNA-binding HxlR family transcriptional regulator [Mumia flava]|uniref:DNA-binding HxlR family transcriptional regulator n=1 Tax=Mumia flava TaxID=1348852 RepID=A0A0B2B387_9ACTN|nr:helix-turn-helix domain-containing protein [Mumia flava]PJJ56115.1 DNA-binding HxlR family transcriptional regulator [Mumia flava]
MDGYSCGLDLAVDLIGGKWKALILWELREGPQRFNSLGRSLEKVSAKMLTQQLKEMQHDGLVLRHSYGEVPPRVEYSMTDLGQQLLALLEPVGDWAEANYPSIRAARSA